MNFLLKNILKPILSRYRKKSFELVLKRSLDFLDTYTIEEIKESTVRFMSDDGGFCDKAGKSDLYYSLFGMFVWEALMDTRKNEKLRHYLKQFDLEASYKDVYLYCISIMYSRISESRTHVNQLKRRVNLELRNDGSEKSYTLFMALVSLYYMEDYGSMFRILRKIDPEKEETDLPSPVIAAKAILCKTLGKDTGSIEKKLLSFYKGNGSFSALNKSPVGDLLSTSVVLYALNFIDADIRTIKPECLEYIDSLYKDGSFRASQLDIDTDIEYTFYGLLAMGSLV